MNYSLDMMYIKQYRISLNDKRLLDELLNVYEGYELQSIKYIEQDGMRST